MNKLKALWDWLWEGKYVYLFILLVFLPSLVEKTGIYHLTEPILRVYGLGLQLFGAVAIVRSIKDKIFTYEG